MIQALPLALLLLAILWALHGNLPRDVRSYFLAQLYYTVVILVATLIFGTRSPIYAMFYSIFTFVIIFMMFDILRGKLLTFRQVLLSWTLGVIVGWQCFAALPKPLHYYQWITLIEGMTLAMCGAFLIWQAPREKQNVIYFWLGLLWLALAAYRLCYTIELGHPYWTNLNRFFPALMCFVAFSAIAWSARRKSEYSTLSTPFPRRLR